MINMMQALSAVHKFMLSLFLVAVVLPSPAYAQDRLASLVGDGGVVMHSPNGETLVSINPDRALIPASLIKIPLAQVALKILGEDFRFETHFYRNDSGDLLIRGLGDPFLVSEEIAVITDVLEQRGFRQFRRLVVDDSAFESAPDLPLELGSSQPFSARNSALAVNFNTVNLAWTADGSLVSGESQTPLTPLAKELGAPLSSGGPQRINLGDDPATGLRQAQQLFRIFFEESGITVIDEGFYREAVSDEWTLFYDHASSRSLNEILKGLLRYSNNFIANQLFLTLGAHTSGYPATTEKSRLVMQQQLTELYGDGYGQDPRWLLMLEGSGLSREQRSSASGMIHILEVFSPIADLLPEVNGALRKSGTLTGVYNFAGYLTGPDGLYPFVIMTNQTDNNRAEILQLLQAQL
jgi:D-alanyl-D-alanine carboxypeptidase/D-alanyl-D-alanine-endopeptidase (penicillin-binding protein 4)